MNVKMKLMECGSKKTESRKAVITFLLMHFTYRLCIKVELERLDLSHWFTLKLIGSLVAYCEPKECETFPFILWKHASLVHQIYIKMYGLATHHWQDKWLSFKSLCMQLD